MARVSIIVFVGSFVVLGGLATPLAAAGTENTDWPCVQRKVAKLSAGTMWAGPPIDEVSVHWRDDENVRTLVNLLSVRRTSLEEAEVLVQTFSSTLEGARKTQQLVLTFTGLLKKANTERAEVLNGIERYTRKQRKLADGIQNKRRELETILKIETPTDEDDQVRRALEQELGWQTRIHEDREKSLAYVCEIPVLLEQRMFALARILAGQID